MIPGELLVADGDIELAVGRATRTLVVSNTGDRPIQVGSHYHFAETNTALDFDRAAARGFRLNIAAGTAVRFEPGQWRTVELVALAGEREVYGFNGLVMGRVDEPPRSLCSLPPKGATPPLGRPGGRRSHDSHHRPRSRTPLPSPARRRLGV